MKCWGKHNALTRNDWEMKCWGKHHALTRNDWEMKCWGKHNALTCNDWEMKCWGKHNALTRNDWEMREREMFYLTTHSTHFIYSYMASDIWLRTILIMRKETRCRHIGYSYRLTARVLLYAPSHRQDNTYHSLCYTSCGALAGTRLGDEVLGKTQCINTQ